MPDPRLLLQFQTTIRKAENDPEFKRLSWVDQMDARATIFMRTLGNDPEFLKLAPAGKQAAIQQVANRPPVFEDPVEGQKTAVLAQRIVEERTNRPHMAAGHVMDGQPSAVFEELNFSLLWGATKNMPLAFGITKAVETYAPRFVKSLMDVSGVGKDSDYYRNIENEITLQEKGGLEARYRDRDKRQAYLDTVLDEDTGTAMLNRVNSVAAKAAPIAGMFIGYGAADKAGQIIASKLIKDSSKVMARSFAARSARLGKFMLPRATEATYGVAREFWREELDYTATDPAAQFTLKRAAGIFTSEVLWDVVLINTLNGLRGIVPGTARAIGGGAKVSHVKGYGADLETFKKAKREVLWRHRDTGAFLNLSLEQQKAIRAAELPFAIADNVKPASELNMLKVYANTMDNEIVELGNGKYGLKDLLDPDAKPIVKTFDEIRNEIATKFIKRSEGGAALREYVKTSPLELGIEYRPGFVNHMATKIFGAPPVRDGDVWKQVIQGKEVEFRSIRELGDVLVTNAYSRVDLDQAAQAVGGKYFQRGDMHYLKVGDKTYRAGSMTDLIDQAPEGFRPKLPSTLAPEWTVVNDKAWNSDYEGDVFIGTQDEVLKHLSLFRDSEAAKTSVAIRGASGRTLTKNAAGNFEVFIPDINYRKKFDTPLEAQKFLEGGWKDIETYATALAEKGYRLDPYLDSWMIYADDGKIFTAKTNDELEAMLKSLPDVEFGPELTGLPAGLVATTKVDGQLFTNPPDSLLDVGKPVAMKGDARAWIAQQWVVPTEKIIEVGVKKGAPPELMEIMQETISTGYTIRGEEFKLNELLDAALTFEDGSPAIRKTYGKGHMASVRGLFETPADKLDDFFKNRVDSKYLDDRWRPVKAKYHELMGTNERKGLYAYFAVGDEAPFEWDYVTRKLREHYNSQIKPGHVTYGDDQTKSLLEGAGIDQRFHPYFEHERVSDIINVAMLEDPITSVRNYIRMGLRKKYLAPSLQKMQDWVNANRESLTPDLARFVMDFIDDSGGKAPNLTEGALRSSANKFLRKWFGRENVTAPLQSLMSTGYSTALGFRAWPIMRNMQQIWLTGARLGNSWVAKGVESVAADPQKVWREMAEAGQFLDVIPGSEFKPTQFQKFSLGGYRNSDDWTRMVMWEATKARYQDASRRAIAGAYKGNAKRFAEDSGLDLLDTSTRDKGLLMANANQHEGAQRLFQQTFTRETLFPYSRALNPRIYRTALGKVFGGFGSYSFWWANNIRNGLFRGTMLQRLGYLTRFAGNSALLAGTATALGIKANAFTPFGPLGFTGGPYFDMAVTAINANPAASQYKSRQARAELLGLRTKGGKLTWDFAAFEKSQVGTWLVPVPGRFMIRSLNRMTQHINDGDYYKAMLAGLSAPEKF